VHNVVVSPWQNMSCPQSASVWQVASWQMLTARAVVATGGQAPPSLMQATTGVATPSARHDMPLGQSLLLVQLSTCAWLVPAASSVVAAIIPASCLMDTMTSSFASGLVTTGIVKACRVPVHGFVECVDLQGIPRRPARLFSVF
jgi:hypothetical protein